MANPGAEAPRQHDNWNFDEMSDCAVLVTDMWNHHLCLATLTRVNELAPRINTFITQARRRGALIVHAPSDTMRTYYDNPEQTKTLAEQQARERARSSKGEALPPFTPRGIEVPLDDSDGGWDEPASAPGTLQRQNSAITVKSEDAIINDGELQLLYNLLQASPHRRRILFTGVAVNECLLNRTFGIRNLVGLQHAFRERNTPYQMEQIVLVADLTDSMYNPNLSPYVNHYAGTDLVVEAIEDTYPGRCAIMLSSQFGREGPFRFTKDIRPYIGNVDGDTVHLQWVGSDPAWWLQLGPTGLRLVREEDHPTRWVLRQRGWNLYTLSLWNPSHPNLSGSPPPPIAFYLTSDSASRRVGVEAVFELEPPSEVRQWHIVAASPTDPWLYRIYWSRPGSPKYYLVGNHPQLGEQHLETLSDPRQANHWRIVRA